MLTFPFSREKHCQDVLTNYLGFIYQGYDSVVQWLEYAEKLPLDNHIWPREMDIPSVGQVRMVLVEKPFNQQLNGEFWTLFQPGYSCLNGWEDYPQEIISSAFIHCQFVSSISVAERCAWIEVKVMDVIPLAKVEQAIAPEHEVGCFLDKLYCFDDSHIIQYQDWLYYYGNDQSNLGNWMLIQLISHQAHLIAFGEWDFDRRTAYIGNLILSPLTCDTLLSRCNRTDLIGLTT